MPKNFAPKHTALFWRKLLRVQRTFHELTFFSEKGKTKNFTQTHRFILAKFLRFQRTFHELTFFSEKGKTKNFTQTHRFILAKFLKFQETFYKKFLVSGFGADSPNIQRTQKSTAMPCPFVLISLHFGKNFVLFTDFFLL